MATVTPYATYQSVNNAEQNSGQEPEQSSIVRVWALANTKICEWLTCACCSDSSWYYAKVTGCASTVTGSFTGAIGNVVNQAGTGACSTQACVGCGIWGAAGCGIAALLMTVTGCCANGCGGEEEENELLPHHRVNQ